MTTPSTCRDSTTKNSASSKKGMHRGGREAAPFLYPRQENMTVSAASWERWKDLSGDLPVNRQGEGKRQERSAPASPVRIRTERQIT